MRISPLIFTLSFCIAIASPGMSAGHAAHGSHGSSLSAGTRGRSAETWTGKRIYFVIPDRFINSNGVNDEGVKPKDPRGFHGGDLAGLTRALPAIRRMGFDLLWITPPMLNRARDFYGSWGYHGYWISDFFAVDPHLGTLDDLRRLVARAHDLGLGVIIDFVANHAEWDTPLRKTRPELFRPAREISDWNDQSDIESGTQGGLPDFDQSGPAARQFLLESALFWFDNTGCDGFRMDSARHVSREFWSWFCAGIKAHAASMGRRDFMILGEVLHGDPSYLEPYSRSGFTALYDYPAYYALVDILTRGAPVTRLASVRQAMSEKCGASALLTFLDNHDQPRFSSLADVGANSGEVFPSPQNLAPPVDGRDGSMRCRRILMAGLTYSFLAGNVPCVYYGTEEFMKGRDDTEGRGDMVFSFSGSASASTGMNDFREPLDLASWRPPLGEYIRRLAAIGRGYPCFGGNETFDLLFDDTFCAILRIDPATGQTGLFAMSVSDEPLTRTLALPLPPGARAELPAADLTGSGGRAVFTGEEVEISLGPRSASAFLIWSGVRGRQRSPYGEEPSKWIANALAVRNGIVPGQTVEVEFRLSGLPGGATGVVICGEGIPGGWDTGRAVSLERTGRRQVRAGKRLAAGTSDEETWIGSIRIQAGKFVDFKFVATGPGGEHWENIPNRCLRVWGNELLNCRWEMP